MCLIAGVVTDAGDGGRTSCGTCWKSRASDGAKAAGSGRQLPAGCAPSFPFAGRSLAQATERHDGSPRAADHQMTDPANAVDPDNT
jgi:hypothetical protein